MPPNAIDHPAGLARNEALLGIARRLIWWMPPEEALEYPVRFLAQVMTLGTWDDMRIVRSVVGEEAMRAVLRDAPPGVFDLRSWHYWRHVFGIDPVPPLPRRQLP